jgi:hypothetical protein
MNDPPVLLLHATSLFPEKRVGQVKSPIQPVSSARPTLDVASLTQRLRNGSYFLENWPERRKRPPPIGHDAHPLDVAKDCVRLVSTIRRRSSTQMLKTASGCPYTAELLS